MRDPSRPPRPLNDPSDALEVAGFWRDRFPYETFVYFIQGRQGTPIKIGSACDVARRVATFQTAQVEELHVLCVIFGGQMLERRLHRALIPSRVRGEWFSGPEVNRMLARAWEQSEREVEEYRLTGQMPRTRLKVEMPSRSTRNQAAA